MKTLTDPFDLDNGTFTKTCPECLNAVHASSGNGHKEGCKASLHPPDEAATALLEIAAAAKAWNRSAVKGTKRLKKAVKAWIAIGG